MLYKNKRELIHAMVAPADTVLDVGFSGQGITKDDPKWPHAILRGRAREVCGVDLHLPKEFADDLRYLEASAEQFHFDWRFDIIFAGDLIEHLSNPGLFLGRCRAHLAPGGRLVLTTPNTFNLFNLAEKITKREPTVNPDHTFYFNSKTLSKLLSKNGFDTTEVSYVYSLEYSHRESFKKKFLNLVYWLLSLFTDKFAETLVVVARI